MTVRYPALLTVLMVLPMLGCDDGDPLDVTSPDWQMGTRLVPADVQHPFKAWFRTTFGQPGDPDYDCDGNVDTQPALIEGIGVATQTGATTYVSDSEIDFGTLVQCGRGTFVAANGDRVLFDYVGPFAPPDADGNVSFAGEWVVTGGTGRFDGATGGGTYEGTANVIVEQGEVSFRGRLVY